jgi:hypothetical protein
MVLTVCFVLSPVTGLVDTVAPWKRLLPESLTPATGRQDHTTSPSAIASLVGARIAHGAIAAIATRPAFRDDAHTPLWWAGMKRNKPVICPNPKANYFFRQVWTAQISLNRQENSSPARTRFCR